MNLKTLKDFESDIDSSTISNAQMALIYGLRMEAVKWIKELKKCNGRRDLFKLKNGRYLSNFYEYGNNDIPSGEGLIDFIKNFFDLSEEVCGLDYPIKNKKKICKVCETEGKTK